MSFLIVEMVVYLVGATVLGLALGAFLRSLGVKARMVESEARWNRRLRVVDDELIAARNRIEGLESELGSKNEALALGSRKEMALIGRVDELDNIALRSRQTIVERDAKITMLQEKLEAHESRLSEFEHELEARDRALASVSTDLERALDRIHELERGMGESNAREVVLEDTLQSARLSNAEVERQLESANEELQAATAQIRTADENIRTLKALVAEAEELATELMIERDALVTAREAQAAVLGEKDAEIGELRKRVSDRAAELEEITSQSRSTDAMLAMLEEQLLNRDSDMSALRMELEAGERTIANLEASSVHVRQNAEELQQKLKRRDSDIEIIRSDLSGRVDAIRSLEQQTHSLETTCATLIGKAESAEEDRLRLQEELRTRETRLARAEELVVERDERLAQVTADLLSNIDKVQHLEREVRALSARALTLEGEVQQRRATGARADEELAALRKRNADQRLQINQLQENIAELSRSASDSPEPTGYPRPDGLLEDPQDEADDLKQIKGIGPVLEEMLNGLGIFYFRQIAAFTHEDVQWVADNLDAFSDRALKGDWVAQAEELARGE